MRCWFRRAGVVLLVLVLVGGLVGVDRSVAADAGGGVVGLGGFSDVGGGVHRAGVDALEAEGVFEGTGCGEGLFCPDDPIHRWVMAVWMVRVLDDGDPAGSGSSRFADVDAGMWWASYVERLAELEVTAGCATGPLRFCPDDPVTRGGRWPRFWFGRSGWRMLLLLVLWILVVAPTLRVLMRWRRRV